MTDSTRRIFNSTPGHMTCYRWMMGLGVLQLIVGLMSTAGSLMPKHLTGETLGDPFGILFTPLIFYCIPSIVIAIATAKLNTSFQLKTMGIMAITVFGVVVTLFGSVTKTNNYFVRADENVTKALNSVEFMYQNRFNLISNLDSTSTKFLGHERAIIKEIADARKSAMHAESDNEKLAAIKTFDASIRNLIVNIEAYPNLKSDAVILELIREITATEKELIAKKEAFNTQITEYNRSIRLFPYTITARILNFQPRRFIDKESSSEIYNARALISTPK